MEQKITTDIKVPNKDMEILKTHFPHCFDKDGKFDFAKFQKELEAQNVELSFEKESYGLDWLGKSYARLLASDPATTLLKADETHNQKSENINSQNLLIKGDNLEALKHLANAYYEKVKMIYIDPPYNTGSDGFVYNDDRKYTVEQLQELLGIDRERAKRILDFTRSKSNSHSAWLTFMYPRLYIARQLLRDDGVIFVSIDDNEVAQLRLLMDEIFGEENFISSICWHNNVKGRQMDMFIKNTFENILVYSKSNSVEINTNIEQINTDNLERDTISFYKKGYPLHNGTADFDINNRPNLAYSIYYNPLTRDAIVIDEKQKRNDTFIIGDVSSEGRELINTGYVRIIPKFNNNYNIQRVWRWGKEKFLKEYKTELLFIKENDGYYIYQKERFIGGAHEKKFKNYINIDGGKDKSYLVNLFQNTKVFENPKPVDLIKHLLLIGSKPNDLILDFFAGSGTTGDAVMQLNAEDGGNRKFILVQLPEAIDPKKNKTAYDFVKNELKAEPTIFEITKERLLRAAKKIKEETIHKKIAEKEKQIKDLESQLDLENKEEQIAQLKKEIQTLQNQDLGFKIFETMPIWEDYDFEAETFDSSQTLFDTGKLTEDDVKALLITWKTYDGMPLTEDLEHIDLNGYTAYYGNGKLYLMHKGFTTDTLKTLLEKIDSDRHFEPKSIIAFGYHFESARLRELSENVKNYANKKHIDIEFIIRY
ncbi:MAG: site-specific DNA-methyltransferase [Fervidobacterium sp.]|nr:site-specific DNA-methyltransferase [Fervidobacterium sp.]NPU90251.1 site-specific DNA-methyltransferase [Fervidobacterium sp.]